MTAEAAAIRLVSVEVDNLLGRFDHNVEFPSDWEFVILHGPNGIGKTKLLELIEAVSTGHLDRLLRMPFGSARLGYDDGTTLSIVRTGQLALPGVGSGDAEPPSLSVTLDRPTADTPVRFPVLHRRLERMSPQRLRMLERELPLERVGPDEWFDHDLGESVALAGLVERYPEAFPPGYLPVPEEEPEEFREFIAQTPVHLIETQRLMVARQGRTRAASGRETSPVTVLRYSHDLMRKLNQALADNTTTSQRLDRSFPERVLNSQLPEGVTDEQIRRRYEEQSQLRDQLAEISVLDAAADIPLQERELETWERRVLWTYLDDTEKKLATFQPLLERVQLLRTIVNSRFLFKSLRIDREQGFRFETEEGTSIGPAALSSGEQHELVLVYDLLFNVTPGSLVLIDEPEISLHVAWQQEFLSDITEIARLTRLRFVVATHSPQVIHTWWRRAVPLYSEPQGEAAE